MLTTSLGNSGDGWWRKTRGLVWVPPYHGKRFFGGLRAPRRGVGPQHWKDSRALNGPSHRPGERLWSGSRAWQPGSGCQEPLLVGPVSSSPATLGRSALGMPLTCRQSRCTASGRGFRCKVLYSLPVLAFLPSHWATVPAPGPWAHGAVSPCSPNDGPGPSSARTLLPPGACPERIFTPRLSTLKNGFHNGKADKATATETQTVTKEPVLPDTLLIIPPTARAAHLPRVSLLTHLPGCLCHPGGTLSRFVLMACSGAWGSETEPLVGVKPRRGHWAERGPSRAQTRAPPSPTDVPARSPGGRAAVLTLSCHLLPGALSCWCEQSGSRLLMCGWRCRPP